MVSFEIFVKSMPPSLSELKVITSFCFAFKIPDDVTATNKYVGKRKLFRRIFYEVTIWILILIRYYKKLSYFLCSENQIMSIKNKFRCNFIERLTPLLMVSQFRNILLVSSNQPKNQQNLWRISALASKKR